MNWPGKVGNSFDYLTKLFNTVITTAWTHADWVRKSMCLRISTESPGPPTKGAEGDIFPVSAWANERKLPNKI